MYLFFRLIITDSVLPTVVNVKKCLRFLFINYFYLPLLDQFDMYFLKTTETLPYHGSGQNFHRIL